MDKKLSIRDIKYNNVASLPWRLIKKEKTGAFQYIIQSYSALCEDTDIPADSHAPEVGLIEDTKFL